MSERITPHEQENEHDAPRDEVLNAMCQNGWANESGGDTDNSPYGWFARISTTKPELTELVAAFEQEIDAAGLDDINQLLGNFLLVDNAGSLKIAEYFTEEEVKADYQRIADAYASWLAESEGFEG